MNEEGGAALWECCWEEKPWKEAFLKSSVKKLKKIGRNGEGEKHRKKKNPGVHR